MQVGFAFADGGDAVVVDRTARDGADHFADHIGLGRTGILDVAGLDPDAQARVDEAVRSVVEQVEQLCGDVVVARQALVVGERTGVEIGLVILRAAGELHGGVVVVRLEDGVFARVGDDLVDLLADRGGEGVVTAAHAHQQTQAQRVGEFLPLGDVAAVDAVLGGVVQPQAGVVERVGQLEFLQHGRIDLLLRVDMRGVDALAALERLAVGDRTEHVGEDRHVIDLQRQADGLEVGLVLRHGQVVHVLGIAGPFVPEVPDGLEIAVGKVVAVFAARCRLGHGDLRNLVGDAQHVGRIAVRRAVNQRFEQRDGGYRPFRLFVRIGVVILEIVRTCARCGEQREYQDIFCVFHGVRSFRTEV